MSSYLQSAYGSVFEADLRDYVPARTRTKPQSPKQKQKINYPMIKNVLSSTSSTSTASTWRYLCSPKFCMIPFPVDDEPSQKLLVQQLEEVNSERRDVVSIQHSNKHGFLNKQSHSFDSGVLGREEAVDANIVQQCNSFDSYTSHEMMQREGWKVQASRLGLDPAEHTRLRQKRQQFDQAMGSNVKHISSDRGMKKYEIRQDEDGSSGMDDKCMHANGTRFIAERSSQESEEATPIICNSGDERNMSNQDKRKLSSLNKITRKNITKRINQHHEASQFKTSNKQSPFRRCGGAIPSRNRGLRASSNDISASTSTSSESYGDLCHKIKTIDPNTMSSRSVDVEEVSQSSFGISCSGSFLDDSSESKAGTIFLRHESKLDMSTPEAIFRHPGMNLNAMNGMTDGSQKSKRVSVSEVDSDAGHHDCSDDSRKNDSTSYRTNNRSIETAPDHRDDCGDEPTSLDTIADSNDRHESVQLLHRNEQALTPTRTTPSPIRPPETSNLGWMQKLIIFLWSDKESIVQASLSELASMGCVHDQKEEDAGVIFGSRRDNNQRRSTVFRRDDADKSKREETSNVDCSDVVCIATTAYRCGAHSSIVGAMNRWYEYPVIQVLGCRALHSFGCINKEFRSNACQLGAIETLLLSLRNFPEHQEIQKHCSSCLCCYSVDKEMAKRLILKLDGLGPILRAMRLYDDDGFVQMWCCSALEYMTTIASDCPDLLVSLRQDETVQVLLRVIEKFPDSTNPDHCLIQHQAQEAIDRLMSEEK